MSRPPDRLTPAGRRQPLALNDPKAVDRALRAAVAQLDAAQQEQEHAANRILGLTELLIDHVADDATRLRIEAIMEACAFQDVSGQRLKRVRALLSRLTTQTPEALRINAAPIDAEAPTRSRAPVDDPARPAPRRDPTEDESLSTGQSGLSQAEVDRLLGKR